MLWDDAALAAVLLPVVILSSAKQPACVGEMLRVGLAARRVLGEQPLSLSSASGLRGTS